MIDPESKMSKLEYGTLSKERRAEMKKLLSFDAWLKLLSFLILLSITAYLTVIIHEYYLSKNPVYEIIDIEDYENSKILFEDVSDEEMDLMFEDDDPNKTAI